MKYTLFALLFIVQSCGSQEFDKNIVLINAGDANRQDLAGLIDQICDLNPKVVAIDILFYNEQDENVDNLLKEALGSCRNLVMVSMISDYSTKKPFQSGFADGSHPKFTRNARTGFGNFVSEGMTMTVSRFSLLEYVDGRAENSFAVQTAFQFDSIRTNKYIMSHDNYGNLDFSSGLQQFKTYSIADIESGKFRNEITGKIVMVGYLGPGMEDKHHAPLPNSQGPNVYGVELHALIVKQVLGN